MTIETVLRDALSLSPQERSILAEELWRSVPHQWRDLELTPEQAEDLQRRIDEDAAGASDPQEWEHVRPNLRSGK